MPVAPTAAALVVVVAASPSQWREACLRLPLLDLGHSRLRSVAKWGEGSVRSSESVVKTTSASLTGGSPGMIPASPADAQVHVAVRPVL